MPAHTITRRFDWRILLSWVPTFLGFPLGGTLAYALAGPADSLGRTLLGGAIAGTVLGTGQWLMLRTRLRISPLWIAATGLGFALGAGIGGALTRYNTGAAALALDGAILGAAVGGMQALVLRRHIAGWAAGSWAAAAAPIWALGWTISRAIGIDVSKHWVVFGSSGALVVTIFSGVLLSYLLSAPAATPPSVVPATAIEPVIIQQGGVR